MELAGRVVEVEGPETTDQLADTARLLWCETGTDRPGAAYAGQQLGFAVPRAETGTMGRGRVLQPRAGRGAGHVDGRGAASDRSIDDIVIDLPTGPAPGATAKEAPGA